MSSRDTLLSINIILSRKMLAFASSRYALCHLLVGVPVIQSFFSAYSHSELLNLFQLWIVNITQETKDPHIVLH